MKQIIVFLFCCCMLLQGAQAQASKNTSKNTTTKKTTTTKPTTKPAAKPTAKPANPAPKPADKPASATTNTGIGSSETTTQPTAPATPEIIVKDGPLTKYELYSQLRNYLENNGLKNWILAERLSNFIIAFKEPVAIVPEKSETTYESEQKELEALSKVYLPKLFEISIEFSPYATEQLRIAAPTDNSAEKKMQELKEKYSIGEIFENVETKEYYAASNDERNRLANFLIAKTFIEVKNTEANLPQQFLYIQNFSVNLNYPQNYYLTIPKQAGTEADRIVQFIQTTILSRQ
ncbi:hypothetical protein B6N25_04005 [Sphingobacteriales bacterium TSM_CSS]|nr:hypothetical protein B6N25_04005 [Sphingobacteriales bacterium TSM_CSS]